MPAWTDDALADDVATLSYEHALHTHARYHSADGDEVVPQAATPRPASTKLPAAGSTPPPVSEPFSESDAAEAASALLRSLSKPLERNTKCASITIRMSKEECDQLHQRAAEAGLSVSAYLRSCTFEAENLRAMVKETMAQLRAATAASAASKAHAGDKLSASTKQTASLPRKRSGEPWWPRLWARRHQHTAGA